MTHAFERILLATEHTEFDAGAERVAFDLVKRCGLPLAVVVPVFTNPEYEAIAPQIVSHAEEQAAEKIESLRKKAAAEGVEISITARRGEELYHEIVQEATERQSDLIILRRRGKRGFLSNVLVGEMVSKVMRHAPCSVLFVPRAARMWTQGVLAAIDTSPVGEHVASLGAKTARQSALPLHIVSVLAHDTPANRAQTEETLVHARAVAESAGIAAPGTMMVTGKPHEQVLSMAKTLNADLIVVGRHGETNLIRMPFGGTTQKVLGLTETPVLVVRI
jgi:nucleotide-binding universal stress UspA family protein